MSTEENKATARRLQEESFGGGKPELVDDLLAPTSSVTTLTSRQERSEEHKP